MLGSAKPCVARHAAKNPAHNGAERDKLRFSWLGHSFIAPRIEERVENLPRRQIRPFFRFRGFAIMSKSLQVVLDET